MALFDAKNLKAMVDDTIPLICTVETCENLKGFTEYVIRVSRNYDQKPVWEVKHRYNEFASLNDDFKKRNVHFLPLPPKKLVGNKEREFLSKRMHELQIYLDKILQNLYLSNTLAVKHFLDPYSYSVKYQEQSLQNVSMCLKNLNNFDVVKPLLSIGWRIRKHFFLLKPKDKPKERMVGVWAAYGPCNSVDVKDCQNILEFYCKLECSLFSPPRFINCTENGILIVRDLYPSGSIRDLLHKSKFDDDFLKKYCTLKDFNSLDAKDVVLVAKHILVALKFLHDRGLFHGHLHCGNIALSSSNALHLLELENCIIGLPSLYRSYLIKSKAIKTVEDVDVYCFGQTLYELLTGEPLNSPFLNSTPQISSDFGSVLMAILSEDANKKSLPSFNSLLENPAFSTWFDIGSPTEKTFKISVKLKNALATFKNEFEQRLHAEQAEYRKSLAKIKVEHFLNSDEQKQLRKRISCNNIESVSNATPVAENLHTIGDNIDKEDKKGNHPSLAAVVPPAPSAPPPPPPPPPPQMSESTSMLNSPSQRSLLSNDSGSSDRSALLDSIRNFKSTKSLKKLTDK